MHRTGNTTEPRRSISRRAALALTFGLGALVLGAGCRVSPRGTPLAEQTVAAPFTAQSSLGELDAGAALGRGPLVLIFYRGHW
jgi:hypothetical protein